MSNSFLTVRELLEFLNQEVKKDSDVLDSTILMESSENDETFFLMKPEYATVKQDIVNLMYYGDIED